MKPTLNQLNNIQEKIDQTIKQGGRLITGGEKPEEFKNIAKWLY